MSRNPKPKTLLQAEAEVALAKKLLVMLTKSEAKWFFEQHPEHGWHDVDAISAWEAFAHGHLDAQEIPLFNEHYLAEFSSPAELQEHLKRQANRSPCLWNIDGW